MIPFIVAGAAGLIGLGGHLSAKETNERAQQLSQEAQSMYDSAKEALEKEQSVTEQSLLKLGKSKKLVMDVSIKRFLSAYDRIKDVQLSGSVGMDELSRFSVDQQDTIELQEMSNIYSSSVSSGSAGAAAGAMIALAASGNLSLVAGALAGTLSAAGTALVAGELGTAVSAVGMAGSVLSLSAAMTPLSAIAAPVVLFTGISASMKADENLEKATEMHAEAEEACEKMEVAQTLCKAIAARSNMFDKLLGELDSMYSTCTVLLDQVTKAKVRKVQERALTSADFTEEERKLIAVTRALTGAVKAVIDTPIISKEGEVSSESKFVYDNTMKALPSFSSQVAEVQSYNYAIRPTRLDAGVAAVMDGGDTTQTGSHLLASARNLFALCLGVFLGFKFVGTRISIIGPLWDFALSSSIIILLIMDTRTPSKLFGLVKKICCASMAVSFGALFWLRGTALIDTEYFVAKALGVAFLALLALGFASEKSSAGTGNIRQTISKISGCIFFFCAALLLLSFCYGFIGLPLTLVMIVLEAFYILFALASTFI